MSRSDPASAVSPAAGEAPLSRSDLISASLALGAREVAGWSRREETLARAASHGRTDGRLIARLRERIRMGEDPLGSAFVALRTRSVRRRTGTTYTPEAIVHAMLESARVQASPQRIVDPGAGSGRFLLRAAKVFPAAMLVGVEVDPLAALIARANLAAAGAASRSTIVSADYRRVNLRADLQSLFVGNPPYVRHHLIRGHWKDWLVKKAQALGVQASRLAGLHAYFFVATALNARRGDCGVFITAAEWLDVNYGSALRDLFRGPLGGQALTLIHPAACPFPDAATTAVVTAFRFGARPSSVRVRLAGDASEIAAVSGGCLVSRRRLETQPRWSQLTGVARRRPSGLVELGELCAVHRGQATGANAVWIADEAARDLPHSVLFPCVTRARELIAAGRVLENLRHLRHVIDLPADLDVLERGARDSVERFLAKARRKRVHQGYLARHRRAWWAVGLPAPAPILATYMARRAPVFSRNPLGARHINIAHGLYPREALSEAQLAGLVDHLCGNVRMSDGRTYAGGLTKFEPREMQRLLVPEPQLLGEGLLSRNVALVPWKRAQAQGDVGHIPAQLPSSVGNAIDLGGADEVVLR